MTGRGAPADRPPGSLRIATARPRRWVVVVAIGVVAFIGVGAGLVYRTGAGRMMNLRQYWADPGAHEDWQIHAGRRCGAAPFVMPTDGYIAFVWGDSFRAGHAHQGLDIFGPTGPDGIGQTPVVAVYDGFLTRLPGWHSAVIMRHPEDPLQPGRQIWTYYTHMADPDGHSFIDPAFPPGTRERFVRAGTRLGFQGNYSADPMSPVGMHLHFSIVKDDGRGNFENELNIANTIDPSPYLGLEVNAQHRGSGPPVCPEAGA